MPIGTHDRDCQVTLRFKDGSEQTFPILRDRNMSWRGEGTSAPLVEIAAKWFDNPITQHGETRKDG